MDIMEELIDQIACNDLNAVEQNLKFNSGMIFLDERAKSLLKFAPTHEMVYTLINYTPSKRELPVWTQSRDSDIKEIKGMDRVSKPRKIIEKKHLMGSKPHFSMSF